jgi:hypothetical protein
MTLKAVNLKVGKLKKWPNKNLQVLLFLDVTEIRFVHDSVQ